MKFRRHPTAEFVHEDGRVISFQLWGARRGHFTFCISKSNQTGEIKASVKPIDTAPYDGTRLDLGVFPSMETAEKACHTFKPS